MWAEVRTGRTLATARARSKCIVNGCCRLIVLEVALDLPPCASLAGYSGVNYGLILRVRLRVCRMVKVDGRRVFVV